MLERFQKLRPAVDQVTARAYRLGKLHLGLDEYDWYWVQQLTEILTIFCEATEDMSEQSYATIYSQYPYFVFLSRELQRLKDEYSGETLGTCNETLFKAVTAGRTKLDQLLLLRSARSSTRSVS
jgi:hypothetical protein